MLDQLEPTTLSNLKLVSARANDLFRRALADGRSRVATGELAPVPVHGSISFAISEQCIEDGTWERKRLAIVQAALRAAVSKRHQGRELYLELSDDPDDLFGRGVFRFYVKRR